MIKKYRTTADFPRSIVSYRKKLYFVGAYRLKSEVNAELNNRSVKFYRNRVVTAETDSGCRYYLIYSAVIA